MKLGISFSLARTNCQQNQLRHPKVFPGKTPIRQLLTLLWKMYSDKILSLKNLKGHWTIWGEFFHTDNPSRILKPAVLKMFEFTTQINNLKINMLLLANLVVQVCFKATRLFTCKHFLWIICFLNITGNVASFFKILVVSVSALCIYFNTDKIGVL